MKISYKLFFAFIGLTSVVLIATLSLARWSFDQGFLNFINALEQERLQIIADDLVLIYQQNNHDWQGVNQSQLSQIFKRHQPSNNSGFAPQHPPPRPRPRSGIDNGPKHERAGAHRPPPPHLRNKPNPPRKNTPPTGLYSANDELLAGADVIDVADIIYFPVVLNEQVIAKLYSAPIRKASTNSAKDFVNQQLSTSLWIGLLCLLLAGSISWVLARLLLEPVNKVMKGISFLSRGNYSERFNAQGKDELDQLMNDIDHLAMTLDKTRSAKNRWFADISHELRTPLSVLCGEIDAIKAGIRPFDQPQLLSLEQEVMRIKHLVDDLYQLALADLGGLKYHFERLDVSDSINMALSSLGQQFTDKGLIRRFENTQAVFINGDKMRIQQLLTNVLLNAIAYTDSPGVIEVQISQDNNLVNVFVNDTKPSVAEEDCEQLFEPLFRMDESRVKRANGAGLGLTICRNIVEAHSGRIQAKPSSLGGLSIHIQLPIFQGQH